MLLTGFSVMTAKASRGVDAKINSCMHVTMVYAARVKPQVVIMESVRPAFTMGRGLMQALRDELEDLSGARYDAYHVMQDALELGGAARRPRYFLVLSRVPFGVEYPEVRTPNVMDVFGDLAGLSPTWEAQPYRRPATWWSEDARSKTGVVDGHIGINSPYVQRCLELLNANGGWPQSWAVGKVAKRYYEEHGELPPSWKHLEATMVKKDFQLGFTTMVRWPEDRPARVVTGAALGCIMHPTENRTVTHREVARVMGFPDDWHMLPLRGTTGLAATHGKGITTQCGKWVGEWVQNSLDGEPGTNTGVECGDRERLITATDRLSKSLIVSTRVQDTANPT
jgi:site-specific DNA-cytosine methylase